VLIINCKSSKITTDQEINDRILNHTHQKLSSSIPIDTFIIYSYGHAIVVNKQNFEKSEGKYAGLIKRRIIDLAYEGDTNSISAIINFANAKNYTRVIRGENFRGKRIFEHILYNIASEIYCGNPWADLYKYVTIIGKLGSLTSVA
jgi:hypothetical protein